MRKIPKLNKVLALVLVLVLFASASVGVYADESDGQPAATESVDNANDDGTDSGDEGGTEDGTSAGDASVQNAETNSGNQQLDNAEPTPGGDALKKDDSEQPKGTEDDKTITDPETPTAGPDEESKSDGKEDEKDKAEDGKSDDVDRDKDKDKDDKDKDAEEEHPTKYESNDNGTHKVLEWDEEKGEYVVKVEDEECQYDEDGVCSKCKHVDESKKTKKDETSEEKKEITKTAEFNGFTIEATYPKTAFDEEEDKLEFYVGEVNESVVEALEKQFENQDEVTDPILTAFEIEFRNKDGKVNPKEKVKISIKTFDYIPKNVIHVEGEDYKTINFSIEKFDDEKYGITFESATFSPFIVMGYDDGTKMDDVNSDGILYGSTEKDTKRSPYGFAYTNESHLSKNYYINQIEKDYAALKLTHCNTSGKYADIAPGSNSYFVYENEKITLNLFAPENYYIQSVALKNGETIYSDDGARLTELKDKEITLKKFGVHKQVNEIVINLQVIPIEKDGSETTIASGATLINYKDSQTGTVNYLKAFGDTFYFNHGNETGSNKCNYGKVYQGLASNTYDIDTNTFKLASGNTTPLFPDSDEPTYVMNGGYHPNVGVSFFKDKDGYWTIDSASTRYAIVKEDDQEVLKPVDGEKSFRPFGDDNHFAMALPIKFSVSNGGKNEDGKDTIFKFSGDDDVFVYIDGKLVLDIGGIHDAMKGQINFATGEILIQGDHDSVLTSSVNGSCYAKKGIEDTNLYSVFDKSKFFDKEHDLTVIYFERGASRSNCRISFNFNKTEEVNVEYEGFKNKADGKTKLEGAKFALYEDEACKNPAMIGTSPAEAVSDADGTIKFAGLSAGVLKTNKHQTSKTYYMKEVQAPTGYVTPENAIWKLVAKAERIDGKVEHTSVLTAVTDEAKELSIGDDEKVTAIKNENAKPGKLKITKKLDSYYKTGGTATFVFEVYYKVGNDEFSNVYPLDFTNPGTKSTEEIEIPAGAEVTITEIYDGATYKLTKIDAGTGSVDLEKKLAKVTIKSEETSQVKFENDYNGKDIFQSISITNVFEKVQQVVDGIRYKFKEAIRGGVQ